MAVPETAPRDGAVLLNVDGGAGLLLPGGTGGGIASLDFQRALTISTAAAWGVWLLFVALAVYMVKKSSGKPRPKRV